jgi:hypothetical protein
VPTHSSAAWLYGIMTFNNKAVLNRFDEFEGARDAAAVLSLSGCFHFRMISASSYLEAISF